MNLPLSDFYRDLRHQRIVLAFLGVFSQEIMVECRKIITDRQQIDQNVSLVLTSVFVELTENILRYSAEREMRDGVARGVGIVVVQETQDSFTVVSGNQTAPQQGKHLLENCERLNTLDKEQLRQLYRERRREARAADQSGAGLGLIEIARRASAPMQCQLIEQSDEVAFVSLEIAIAK
ncbi:MAG: SiaB family protein kinase [Opitutales bacterium]